MGLRLIAGRRLNAGDSEGSTPALVVNRSFAAQYLGDNPVGQRLNFRGAAAGSAGMSERGNWEVVGVVEDMKQGGLDRAGVIIPTADTEQPEMFSSYRQLGAALAESVFLIVRTTDDPSSLTPTLRALVREHAPSLVVDSVMTMEDRLMASLAKPRTYAIVLAGFALFAVGDLGRRVIRRAVIWRRAANAGDRRQERSWCPSIGSRGVGAEAGSGHHLHWRYYRRLCGSISRDFPLPRAVRYQPVRRHEFCRRPDARGVRSARRLRGARPPRPRDRSVASPAI